LSITSTRGTHALSRTLSAMPESKSKRSRYTPPPPKKAPPSKLWVPVGLTTMLAVGLFPVGVAVNGLDVSTYAPKKTLEIGGAL